MKPDAKHRNYHFVCKEIVFERVNRRGLQFAVGSDNRVTFGNLSFLTPSLVVHFFHGICSSQQKLDTKFQKFDN